MIITSSLYPYHIYHICNTRTISKFILSLFSQRGVISMRILSTLLIAVLVTLGAIGCGNGSSDKGGSSTSGTVNGTTTSGSSACEQFLNDYEAFADSHIDFMKEYKNNPSDMSLLSRYADMTKKVADMAQRTKECEGDASMAPRLAKIQEKITSAAY